MFRVPVKQAERVVDSRMKKNGLCWGALQRWMRAQERAYRIAVPTGSSTWGENVVKGVLLLQREGTIEKNKSSWWRQSLRTICGPWWGQPRVRWSPEEPSYRRQHACEHHCCHLSPSIERVCKWCSRWVSSINTLGFSRFIHMDHCQWMTSRGICKVTKEFA